MSEADAMHLRQIEENVNEHNRRDALSEIVGHLRAAENCIDQALGALDDLALYDPFVRDLIRATEKLGFSVKA